MDDITIDIDYLVHQSTSLMPVLILYLIMDARIGLQQALSVQHFEYLSNLTTFVVWNRWR